jgi:hypothetical protein
MKKTSSLRAQESALAQPYCFHAPYGVLDEGDRLEFRG